MKSVLRSGLLLGALLTTGVLVAGPAVSAGAAGRGHGTTAKVVGTVKIDKSVPGVAHVLAQYRCTIADPTANPGHLWVSVKQNDAGKVDPAIAAEGSGSSGTATRWEDSHRNAINCNGKTHTARFTVDQVEGKTGYKTLTKGMAWVQFCLFDDTTPKGDGVTDFGQPVSSMVWVHVH
ncbi:MAG TPA: hypothetical protein VGN51_10250 [Acidimicrobiia bacterium]|jgi:hypothetical protein